MNSLLFPFKIYQIWMWPFYFILWVLSFVYRVLVFLDKMTFYLGIRKKIKLGIPVISIGNLTVGGTGKTPVIIFLVNLLQNKGLKVGVVCRNYKSENAKEMLLGTSRQAVVNVDLKSDAKIVGDEAVLIKRKTNAMVYSGSNKSEVALKLAEENNLDLILIDDGFQHHRLFRDCDLVLLDPSQDDSCNWLLPLGRYREPFSNIKRASMIGITKVQTASQAVLANLEKKIAFKKDKLKFSFSSELFEAELLTDRTVLKKCVSIPKDKWVLVSGIARPESFRESVNTVLNKAEWCEKIFKDHHSYEVSDLNFIFDVFEDYSNFITTEKDFVKLAAIWPKEKKLFVLAQETSCNFDQERVFEILNSYIYKTN